EPPQGPDPERAVLPAWATVNFLEAGQFGDQGFPLVGQHSNANNLTTSQDRNPDPQAAEVGRISNPSYAESAADFGDAAKVSASGVALAPRDSLSSSHEPINVPEPDDFWSSLVATKLFPNTL